jgi:hypothetical protein
MACKVTRERYGGEKVVRRQLGMPCVCDCLGGTLLVAGSKSESAR